MYPINLDNNLAKKLDSGMRSGETADLPFNVVYTWALNGQPSYKSTGGALYYGGWACKAEDLQAVSETQGISIPRDWKQVTISTRDSEEFEAYTTRSILVAPIGKRESWLHDGKRSTEYVEGGRRHLQVLAYMAEAVGENGTRQFLPWGPIVLTAKGYQARNLLDAFSVWNKATAQMRWKVAPGVPAWCFYLSLGTFSKERQAISVGKPGAQSPITPISAYVPERFTEELIASLYVGNEIAAKMGELLDQSTEWLNGWKGSALVEAEEFQDTPVANEEDIPF